MEIGRLQDFVILYSVIYRTIQVIAEKPIKVLRRTLYRTKVNFSSRDSLHLLEECRDQMQVSVIGLHDTGIFQKKRTLPYILRIKLTNITLKSEKKISIAQKGLQNTTKKYILQCAWIYDILQKNNNCS